MEVDCVTSEVALLNRSAVALAADSAATVTYWNPQASKHEERYFKRANKIFNIISGKPVGLMTYAAGSLQGMPWEVLAKAFRDDRIGHVADTLPAYATNFFDYLAGNRDIFPEVGQLQHLTALVSEAVTAVSFNIIFDDGYKNETDPQKKLQIAENFVSTAEVNVAANGFINDVAEGILDEIRADASSIIDSINSTDEGKFLSSKLGEPLFSRLITLAIERVFKEDLTPLNYTGVVVAGYGDKQYMPQLEQFKVYGIFNNKLIYTRFEDGCKKISFENTSEIVPIAQSTMVNTFRLGADISTLGRIDSYVGVAIDEFAAELVKAGHLSAAANVDPMKTTVTSTFTDKVREHIWTTHGRPLRQVVGMLSPEELAELAETFVSAESLKERVTKPSETVSGPVDVAVISKSDGFIWIKRKHYFNPELNLRFIAKRQQEVSNQP
jgi:hypothetical protein